MYEKLSIPIERVADPGVFKSEEGVSFIKFGFQMGEVFQYYVLEFKREGVGSTLKMRYFYPILTFFISDKRGDLTFGTFPLDLPMRNMSKDRPWLHQRWDQMPSRSKHLPSTFIS
jgi:hypothetical protein